MTKIVFHSLAENSTGPSNTDPIQLDADFHSFTSQATGFSSLASLSLVGLAGKFAKYGVMATGFSSRLLPFTAQVASIAAEAATMMAMSERDPSTPLWQNFSSHCVNFAAFRLMGAALPAQNSLAAHFAQSAAMMAGHQAASGLGLEAASQHSLLRQFFDANLSTLHIQAGQTLSGHFTGNRLERIATRPTLPVASASLRPQHDFIRSHANETVEAERPSIPAPDPLDRLNAERATPPPNKPDFEKFKSELQDFHYVLELMVSSCINGLHNRLFQFKEEEIHYNFFTRHFDLCGKKSRGVLHVISRKDRNEALLNLNGLLAERLTYFTTAIRYFEENGQPSSKTQALREQLFESYDRLQILRECMRIFAMRSPAVFQPYYAAIFTAYQGMRAPVSQQTKRVERSTHATQMVTEDVVKRWGSEFLARNESPYTAMNAQILMGRVRYLRGINIGSDFYSALKRAGDAQAHPYSLAIPIIFDPTTGLIVSFVDRSEAARKTILEWDAKSHPFQSATLWIDPIEGGDIQRVTFSSPVEDSRIRLALTGLVGLQVLPRQRAIALESPDLSSANSYNISFQWNVSENPEAELHRVVASNPVSIGTPPVAWRLFTLENAADPIPEKALQLWVLEEAMDGIFQGALIKVVKMKPIQNAANP